MLLFATTFLLLSANVALACNPYCCGFTTGVTPYVTVLALNHEDAIGKIGIGCDPIAGIEAPCPAQETCCNGRNINTLLGNDVLNCD